MNSRHSFPASLPLLALTAAGLLAGAPSALGVSVAVTAAPFPKTMPTSEVVTMWGYSVNGGATASPGAPIVVRQTDLPLVVTLTNNLPEPTSLVVSGQPLPTSAGAGPVWINGSGAVTATGSRPAGDVTSRVRSFVAEAAAGGSQTYTFSSLAPGTYQYQTGTHPGVQHQMGLYGTLIVLPATGQSYPGIAYDKEVTIVVGEVDPRSHAAITGTGTFTPLPLPGPSVRVPPPGAFAPPSATAATPDTSPVEYYPKYFLVNGAPYAPGSTIASGLTSGNPQVSASLLANDTILLRMVNAGLKNHTLQILSPVPGSASAAVPAPYLKLIAEDGNPYAFPKDRYSVFLPPGKTVDALFITPGNGNYPIQDRALALTSSNLVGDSGIQAVLAIGSAGSSPTAANDTYAMAGYTSPAPATVLTVVAPGVLGNDTNPTVNPMTALLQSSTSHGTLAWGALNDGSFTYTPASGFAGVDTFTYKANNGLNSNVATGTITVSIPPVAVNDSYNVVAGGTLNVAAPGILGNDTSAASLPLTVATQTAPSAGTLLLSANGSFTYLAPATTGPVTITYTATDGSSSSNPATVTFNVTSAVPPVTAPDSYTTTAGVPLVVTAPGVLVNDSSPSGLTLTAIRTGGGLTNPTKGVLSWNASNTGGFTYTTTNTTATTDSFQYRATDGLLQSVPTTVTINITAHPAPVANNDTFSAARRTTASYTPVILPVLANDTATNTTLNPATVAIKSTPSRGGTATVVTTGANAGKISYTPALNFRGSDVFTYNVRDGFGSTSNTARVVVNVQ